MVNASLFFAITAIFVAATILLGWYGYKHTHNNDEFLLGRNKTNPTIIALSYGATFLSTSAVVGFGGQAAQHGMVMIWLVVLNLFFGLVVAFLVFGKRTRRLGREMDVFTFSEFLGKRFKSPSIRMLSAGIVLVGMPIYCAAVLLGGVNFIDATIGGVNRDVILIGFSLIVAMYVAYGGVIAVMYNDALQAAIMFIGMAVILLVTFAFLGTDAVQTLTDMWPQQLGTSDKLQSLADKGMNGWTSFPDLFSEIGLTVVTTFLLGVGIGALAQPQLAVRFMSAKDDKSLNKSLIIGGIFMLVIVGSAYTVGAVSNVFFIQEHGMAAVDYVGNIDMIIPTYVNELFSKFAFGDVFVLVFLMALLCASISTMSALLHTMGTSAGYDIKAEMDKVKGRGYDKHRSLKTSRMSTMIMMVIVVIMAYLMPANIIAKATSIFMGITAATLLPAYTHSIFSKNPNLLAAKCSIIVGSVSWALWAFLVNKGIATTLLGIDTVITGSLLNFVDPLIVSLPLAVLAMVLVLLLESKGKLNRDTAAE